MKDTFEDIAQPLKAKDDTAKPIIQPPTRRGEIMHAKVEANFQNPSGSHKKNPHEPMTLLLERQFREKSTDPRIRPSRPGSALNTT